jgi:hypothetical protein
VSWSTTAKRLAFLGHNINNITLISNNNSNFKDSSQRLKLNNTAGVSSYSTLSMASAEICRHCDGLCMLQWHSFTPECHITLPVTFDDDNTIISSISPPSSSLGSSSATSPLLWNNSLDTARLNLHCDFESTWTSPEILPFADSLQNPLDCIWPVMAGFEYQLPSGYLEPPTTVQHHQEYILPVRMLEAPGDRSSIDDPISSNQWTDAVTFNLNNEMLEIDLPSTAVFEAVPHSSGAFVCDMDNCNKSFAKLRLLKYLILLRLSFCLVFYH